MAKQYALANKMTAASLHFQVVCEEDLDKVLKLMTSTFILGLIINAQVANGGKVPN